MDELTTAITNNVAAIAMAGIFIFYLVKKDSASKDMQDRFNTLLTTFLCDANSIIKSNTEAITKIAVTMDNLSTLIKDLISKK